VREMGEEAARAGARIDIQGTFPRIVADETLIRQALRNLLVNALESFDPAGPGRAGGRHGAGARRVVVRGLPESAAPGGVRLLVEDNGAGIAAEDLPHVFTPFFTTKERGTGLGLALAQKTAVVHDGQIEVRSQPGEGTVFTLYLPPRPGGPAPPAPL